MDRGLTSTFVATEPATTTVGPSATPAITPSVQTVFFESFDNVSSLSQATPFGVAGTQASPDYIGLVGGVSPNFGSQPAPTRVKSYSGMWQPLVKRSSHISHRTARHDGQLHGHGGY